MTLHLPSLRYPSLLSKWVITTSPAIMAFGKTAWSKFSQEIFRAYMACSSRCFKRISLDSAMNCSWS